MKTSSSTQHILVLVDFSEGCRRAIDYAIELGGKLPVRFTLLHVEQPLNLPARENGFKYREFECQEITAAEIRLKELAASVAFGFSVNTRIMYGTLEDCIVRCAAANQVDLIIMPPHNCSGMNHLFLESVADLVIQQAHCPVLVVRENRSRSWPTLAPQTSAPPSIPARQLVEA